MTTTMKIGVIAIQGDVEEHVVALEQTLAARQEIGEAVKIKHRGIVGSCDRRHCHTGRVVKAQQ